ncbi:MAG: hypothetical protein D6734_08860 [Candidatus Schekmanbacteria bacterium]|nr:MAG: hypothetical protein D6734_08860 [Candidatus Schekmanbacteria bacterium]
MKMKCYFCKKDIEISGKVSRNDTCPHCGNDIHCCLNCTFFDESKHNKCAETQAEWVSDRERRNYCEYFNLKSQEDMQASAKEKEEARRRAESLFKK